MKQVALWIGTLLAALLIVGTLVQSKKEVPSDTNSITIEVGDSTMGDSVVVTALIVVDTINDNKQGEFIKDTIIKKNK